MMEARPLIGQMVDQYRILSYLAQGGMADVYLARDEALGRQVALKILKEILAHDAQFTERFRREAQTAARLDHPHIVKVYSTGSTGNGQPYLAMQYVAGGSLADFLSRWSDEGLVVPTTQALAIIRPIAVALGVAHQAGVVHRDIKPSNILVRPDGTPVLVDLGIARIQGSAKLTKTGNLLGTPHYMAPEQIQGAGTDGRTDLYALGVVLYELLTGFRPFEAEESVAILHKHMLEAPPPVGGLRPGLALETVNVVETCLQKEPEARYQTAADLVAAIDQAVRAEGAGNAPLRTTVLLPGGHSQMLPRQPAPAAPAPAARKMLWLVAGGMVVALLALLGWSALQNRDGAVSGPATAVATRISPTEAATADDTAVAALPPSETPSATATPELTMTAPPAQTATIEAIVSQPAPSPSASPAPSPAATPLPYPLTITGQDGVRMHLVPGGPFIMGSTEEEVNAAFASCVLNPDGQACHFSEFSGEIPRHTVFVNSFYMDETEVTNGQYRACMQAGGCADLPATDGRYDRAEYYEQAAYASYPVVWVRWEDALAYCQWAGKRLPTEAEWEKAARGEDGRLFPWGSVFQANRANTQENGVEMITAVGQYEQGASPYGLLDMAGNVWEYVADWYGPDYYAQTVEAVDPGGPASSPDGVRVLRGGSYGNFQHYARAANRGIARPGTRTPYRGFRCAMDVTAVP